MKSFKIFKTVILMIPVLLWGITLSMEWSTFPEMRLRLNTDLTHLAYAISIGNIGGLFGGPTAALADRFAKYADLILASALAGIGITFILYPLSSSLTMLAVLHFVFIFGWGLYQGGAHSEVTRIWGVEAQPVRIILHFGFPIGAMLGPLIVMPFLADDKNATRDPMCNYGNQTVDVKGGAGIYLNETEFLASSAPRQNCSGLELNPESTGDASTIQYAYLIVGLFTMLVASVFVILQCCGLTCKSIDITPKPKNRRDSIVFTSFRQVFSPKDWADGDACYGTMIFIFMNLYFIFELATIKGTQEYLVTYAVDSGHFRSKEAVALNSVLFATGAFGRLIATILTTFIPTPYVLVVGIHGQLLLNLLCLLLGTKSRLNLWILAPILGFFREPLYPIIFSWADHYIILLGVAVGLTDMIGKIFDIGLVALQGYLYDKTVIESVFYTSVAFGSVQCLVVYVMTYFASRKGGRKQRQREREEKATDKTQTELL